MQIESESSGDHEEESAVVRAMMPLDKARVEEIAALFSGMGWRDIQASEQWNALSFKEQAETARAVHGEIWNAHIFGDFFVRRHIAAMVTEYYPTLNVTNLKYAKRSKELTAHIQSGMEQNSKWVPSEENVRKVSRLLFDRIEAKRMNESLDKLLSPKFVVGERHLNVCAKRENELKNKRTLTQSEGEELEKHIKVREKFKGAEIARRKEAEAMGGYTAAKSIESQPKDWLWMAKKNGTGQVYFMLSEPFCEYSAAVIDSRIHKKFWEEETDRVNNPVWRGPRIALVRPSVSHLSRPEWEVKKIALNPFEGTSYVNGNGELCLNQWRPFKVPPRPEEKYFDVGRIIEEWLEMLYPGRSGWLLDYFAHAYQKLTEKSNFGVVFGGEQGIGKDIILDIATHSFYKQEKLNNIRLNHIKDGQFEEWLMRPVIIFGEFHKLKGAAKEEFYAQMKSICAAPPNIFTVNIKYKNLMDIANIHRVMVTTNEESSFPRDHDDRRFLILKSHATAKEVEKFMEKEFGSKDELRTWKENGGGDAFTHLMLDRDISGFDAKRLPKQLMESYDEVRKGIEVEPVIAAALDEAAMGFGKWCGEVPEEVDESRAYWPRFVSMQQMQHCRATFETKEGENLFKVVANRGYLDTLMKTAGYQPVIRPKDDHGGEVTQWRGNKPGSKDLKGSIRVQTTHVYIRSNSIKDEDTVPKMQNDAREFVKWLSEYWKTKDGIDSYIKDDDDYRQRF